MQLFVDSDTILFVNFQMADLGTAEELREEGNRLFGEGNYAQAIETYTRSLDQKKDAVNFCQRAQAYLQMERYIFTGFDASIWRRENVYSDQHPIILDLIWHLMTLMLRST